MPTKTKSPKKTVRFPYAVKFGDLKNKTEFNQFLRVHAPDFYVKRTSAHTGRGYWTKTHLLPCSDYWWEKSVKRDLVLWTILKSCLHDLLSGKRTPSHIKKHPTLIPFYEIAEKVGMDKLEGFGADRIGVLLQLGKTPEQIVQMLELFTVEKLFTDPNIGKLI
jgi:hypothetical protein